MAAEQKPAVKTPSIRTPLGHARGLGSARKGMHHWWMQRMTALALIPLSLYWLSCPRCITTPDYANFINWIGYPGVSIAAILFILASFYHAALGMRVILEDYIHGEGMKAILLLLNDLFFFFLGVTALFAIAYINFALYGHSPG
jgi:succinate dehydrogenase / fumarate reductase membrane anchor subunit